MLSRIIYHPVLFLKRCFAHCFWSLYLQYQESCLSVFNNLRHFLRHLLFLSGVVLIFSEPRLLHSKQKMVSIFSCPQTTLQKVSTFLRLHNRESPFENHYSSIGKEENKLFTGRRIAKWSRKKPFSVQKRPLRNQALGLAAYIEKWPRPPNRILFCLPFHRFGPP